jgi:hypothetical protein
LCLNPGLPLDFVIFMKWEDEKKEVDKLNFNNKAILLPVVDPVPVRADKHIIVIIVNKAMRTNKSPIIIRHLFRRLVVQLFRVFLISIFLYWSRMRIGMLKCLYLLLIVIQ